MQALIQGGIVIQLAEQSFEVHPSFIWEPCPDGTLVGDTFNGTTFAHPAPPSPQPRYVNLATIRDRVTTAGEWSAFAAALDALPPDKRWHLLTLQEGVASDDADAIALLTAIGCDPSAILAP